MVRTGHTVEETVVWYNNTVVGHQASPHEKVFGLRPKLPGVCNHREVVDRELDHDGEDKEMAEQGLDANPFVAGDCVFLKGSGCCMDAWGGPHCVTHLWSLVAVELGGDGVKRHVSHVQLMPGSQVLQGQQDADNHWEPMPQPTEPVEEPEDARGVEVHRSNCVCHPPSYLQDYELDTGDTDEMDQCAESRLNESE